MKLNRKALYGKQRISLERVATVVRPSLSLLVSSLLKVVEILQCAVSLILLKLEERVDLILLPFPVIKVRYPGLRLRRFWVGHALAWV